MYLVLSKAQVYKEIFATRRENHCVHFWDYRFLILNVTARKFDYLFRWNKVPVSVGRWSSGSGWFGRSRSIWCSLGGYDLQGRRCQVCTGHM